MWFDEKNLPICQTRTPLSHSWRFPKPSSVDLLGKTVWRHLFVRMEPPWVGVTSPREAVRVVESSRHSGIIGATQNKANQKTEKLKQTLILENNLLNLNSFSTECIHFADLDNLNLTWCFGLGSGQYLEMTRLPPKH